MPKVIFSPEEQKYLADAELLFKEVRRLEGEKSRLIGENNVTAKKISDLKEQQIVLEKKAQDIIADAQTESNRIINLAQEKLNRANSRDAEASGKLGELNQKIKDAENVKKSNEGLKKNLEILTMEAQNKISKLNDVIDLIKNIP